MNFRQGDHILKHDGKIERVKFADNVKDKIYTYDSIKILRFYRSAEITKIVICEDCDKVMDAAEGDLYVSQSVQSHATGLSGPVTHMCKECSDDHRRPSK